MKKKVTAAELMAKLNADPAFVAQRAKEEEERQRRAAEWSAAEQPLVEDLRKAGVNVRSAWDLVNTSASYTDALPILLAHLQRPYPPRVREGIARAMAVPASKFAWDVLVHLYREERDEDPKDGLAVAIAAAADGETIGDVIALAKDARNGASRLLLLRALERSSSSEARATLMDLGTDPDLKKEIQVILARIRRRKG